MPEYLTAKAFLGLARWVWGLIIVVLLGLTAWWLIATLTGGKNAETIAKVSTNREGAAVESGHDAVDTVGSQAAADNKTHEDVRNAQDQVNAAPGVDAADAAAHAGLHHVRADHR